MPDYSKGKIYKIVCNTTGLVYIGSTCEPTLARRLAGHKAVYKRHLKNPKNDKYMSFEIINNNNCDIILIESINCNSKDELHSRERFHIENNHCLNKVVPLRTRFERTEIFRDEINEKAKEYRNNNKDKIKLQYDYDKKKLYYEANKLKILERNKLKRLKVKEENNKI